MLSVILVAAKVCGEIAERFLKIPALIGELGAGIIIGPHALGVESRFFDVAGPDVPRSRAVPLRSRRHTLVT